MLTLLQIACNIIAGLLHYLFLSVFGWLLVQGINIYYKIVKVYGAEASRLRYYLAIGWGFPAPIVIITASVRFKSYASLNRKCHIHTFRVAINQPESRNWKYVESVECFHLPSLPSYRLQNLTNWFPFSYTTRVKRKPTWTPGHFLCVRAAYCAVNILYWKY